jgi:hypothetical protein
LSTAGHCGNPRETSNFNLHKKDFGRMQSVLSASMSVVRLLAKSVGYSYQGAIGRRH